MYSWSISMEFYLEPFCTYIYNIKYIIQINNYNKEPKSKDEDAYFSLFYLTPSWTGGSFLHYKTAYFSPIELTCDSQTLGVLFHSLSPYILCVKSESQSVINFQDLCNNWTCTVNGALYTLLKNCCMNLKYIGTYDANYFFFIFWQRHGIYISG